MRTILGGSDLDFGVLTAQAKIGREGCRIPLSYLHPAENYPSYVLKDQLWTIEAFMKVIRGDIIMNP